MVGVPCDVFSCYIDTKLKWNDVLTPNSDAVGGARPTEVSCHYSVIRKWVPGSVWYPSQGAGWAHSQQLVIGAFEVFISLYHKKLSPLAATRSTTPTWMSSPIWIRPTAEYMVTIPKASTSRSGTELPVSSRHNWFSMLHSFHPHSSGSSSARTPTLHQLQRRVHDSAGRSWSPC